MKYGQMSKILFQETQKFNQWWLYLIVIGTAVLLIVTFAAAAWESPSDYNMIGAIVSMLAGIAMIVLIWVLKLKTTITEEKIRIHYFPFIKKEWKWSELKSAKVFDYGFVGGWGIRIWTGYGTIYNVRGSKGLHIKTNDKEYVIGTQKEEEMRSSIAHLLK